MSTTAQLSFDFSDRDLQSTETKLQSALECLNSIPHINHGGCGISALAIYRWCKANGVKVNDRPFVVLCEDEWDANHNDKHFNDGDVVSAWFHHIAIKIDGGLYDSRGNLYEVEYEGADIPCEYHLNERELLDALNLKTTWNTVFKRAKQIPVIEYALSIDLSDVRR